MKAADLNMNSNVDALLMVAVTALIAEHPACKNKEPDEVIAMLQQGVEA